VNIVATAGEEGVTRNLQRKAEQSSNLFTQIVHLMRDEMAVDSKEHFPKKEELPSWL
jgi:hypothetical protein